MAAARQEKYFTRLHYSESDLITELPGPDDSGNLKKLAVMLGGENVATVADLYNHPKLAPKCAPEFVSMVLCLNHSVKFVAVKGRKFISSGSAFIGPCKVCKAKNKGLNYCRVKKGHTQPSAPMVRKRKRQA